jgi:hypothetical protein
MIIRIPLKSCSVPGIRVLNEGASDSPRVLPVLAGEHPSSVITLVKLAKGPSRSC